MENCNRCKRIITKGATLTFGRSAVRFCSGVCALTWNRMTPSFGTPVISFDSTPRGTLDTSAIK